MEGLLSMITGVDWKTMIGAILMILGGASILAKLTPTKIDDKIINSILQFIKKLGLTKKEK